jgi:hypothetical protein
MPSTSSTESNSAAVVNDICSSCGLLVSYQEAIHAVPAGQETVEMTFALQELFQVTQTLLTGKIESVPLLGAPVYLSAAIANLRAYMVRLDDADQIAKDQETIKQLGLAVREIGVGIATTRRSSVASLIGKAVRARRNVQGLQGLTDSLIPNSR